MQSTFWRIPVAILALGWLLTSGCTEKPVPSAIELVQFEWRALDLDGNEIASESLVVEKGLPALEAMRKSARIESKSFVAGEFVESINNVQAGPGQYWALYVNQQYADKGIGLYGVDSNQTMEWRLEKIQPS